MIFDVTIPSLKTPQRMRLNQGSQAEKWGQYKVERYEGSKVMPLL
jgi:hypothetical protein